MMKVSMMLLLLALVRENRKFNDGSNKVVTTIEIELYTAINLALIANFYRIIYFVIKLSVHYYNFQEEYYEANIETNYTPFELFH